MTDKDFASPAAIDTSPAPRFLPFLILLFVGSGCAALIYEIVWFQMLQLVIGSSAVSLAVILGTFMGGMCLGSYALPRIVSPRQHPLRIYALMELGIGIIGLLVLFAIPLVGGLYAAGVGYGLPGIWLRGLVAALCLLPPTLLMGATLPAVARWVEATPKGVSWLGFFYGGNIAGAVGGCLLAGFYLLRVHDMAFATYCAVAVNVAVASIALVIAQATPNPTRTSTPVPDPGLPVVRAWPALVTIALSGLCALAAEVIWTRILSLMIGATVYTFSIILAVFLVGLGLGSSVGAALARSLTRPRVALGICQLLQAAAIAWAAHMMAHSLPYWPVDPSLSSSPWIKFRFDLVRCAWAILPSAILWGASFPLALASIAAPGQDPAHLVGRAYAANTVGAIVGALSASLLLIPALGTQHAQQVLIGMSLVGAAFALAPRTLAGWGVLAATATAAFFLGNRVPQIPWQLVAYGRQITTTDYGAHAIYFSEGMNASIAVSETSDGIRYFHVSGKTEASSQLKDMRLQRMLGHIPALLHPNPKSVLIVGCGAGVTSGSFVLYPSVERIVICDIEPLIPRFIALFFTKENYDVVHDPRVQVVYDDARHFVATTREKFDIITSDPIHPWVKGSAVLYSKEYFELCRQRLKPGGFLTQWVPFYESDRAVVQTEIATFFAAFPDGTIWGNADEGYGYDTVMLGQAEPLKIDVDALQQRLQQPDYAAVQQSLAGLDLGTARDLLATYAGRLPDLREWLASAEINRDRSLRLQYLAGMQLNSSEGSTAYGEMLDYRRFPPDIFQASPPTLSSLRQALQPPMVTP
jgi:spermidine synthase